MSFAAGIANGLAEALRVERPDLAWEVAPLDRDGWTHHTGAAEPVRLEARRDDLDAPEPSTLRVLEITPAGPVWTHGGGA